MTSSQALAFWITGPYEGELRQESLPQPGSDEALVRTRYSAISRGTEALVFRGEVPQSEYRRMRAPFQSGDFPAPVKYGYINVGEVEQGPGALLGRLVFSLYPHQTRFVIPADAVLPLPPHIPARRAVLAANLETAINGLWDASPRIGDAIAVIGGGAVGCLIAWLAGRIPGCRVELIDVNPARAAIADALGVGFALPAAAREDADLVIHASGNAEGLSTALRLAGFEAKIVEMSWFGNKAVSLPLGEAFHAHRLSVCASQVGAVATTQRPRWSARRRLALALDLLVEPALDCLITGESPFSELPAVLTRVANSSGDTICHLVTYP